MDNNCVNCNIMLGVTEGDPQGALNVDVRERHKEDNMPLEFRLKGIKHDHAYLKTRNVRKETAVMFGVGFFPGQGSMSGRVVIPIHNERGELVAYAARSIDDGEPKYKFSAGFHKSLEVFNFHRTIARANPQGRIVLVQGFFDCMRVYAAGFQCLALMASHMSEEQEHRIMLLAMHCKGICFMFDGNEAGRKGSAECLGRLARKMLVRVVELADGKYPSEMDTFEVRKSILAT